MSQTLTYTPEQLEEMEPQELFLLYKQTGDETIKWMLAIRYEGMIRKAAMRARDVYSSFAQIEDIINEGILTLLSAIDNYNPESGIKFETYVSKRVRGMIIDLARSQNWMPRNVRQMSKEIDRTVDDLANTLGRFPSEAEVAEKMGITLEKYQKVIANINLGNILPLDAMMETQRGDTYRFEPASNDNRDQPELVLEEKELQQKLAEGISRLRKNEQIVLSLYYEKNLRLKEISQVMELSKPRISQIHARAIEKLRAYIMDYMNDTTSAKGKKEKRG